MRGLLPRSLPSPIPYNRTKDLSLVPQNGNFCLGLGVGSTGPVQNTCPEESDKHESNILHSNKVEIPFFINH